MKPSEQVTVVTGILKGNPKKNLISGDLSKHQGIYIGKVIQSTFIKFGEKKTDSAKRGEFVNLAVSKTLIKLWQCLVKKDWVWVIRHGLAIHRIQR